MNISKSWSKTDSIACGKSGSYFFQVVRPHAKISTHQTCVGQNTFTRNDQDQNQPNLLPLGFCPSSLYYTLLWHWPKIFDKYSNRAASYQSHKFHKNAAISSTFCASAGSTTEANPELVGDLDPRQVVWSPPATGWHGHVQLLWKDLTGWKPQKHGATGRTVALYPIQCRLIFHLSDSASCQIVDVGLESLRILGADLQFL